ncbi:hypothetical protein PF005_g2576 [Phytophthora fragariae]|uniref:Secreted protein n=1 Tax=Phytophthora fragariae TaxID=53985 RepID=A0A6A3TYV8_9STRA|nr:hypothetical protein PF003_g34930 [Phytophthora fragariae]KAE8936661.1 hypothetical protein PF009_g13422 [Phytophthora fragariae]KAE9007387.1 hypothetical protein PF011_g11140 [Phytophthora fragariae]KAE9109274.1 hypothetical protein PF010_g11606 [Phytophthora fragariae]KAE9111887.1 hypothetical protein PF007_g11311 [Phytophthora fragariae]
MWRSRWQLFAAQVYSARVLPFVGTCSPTKSRTSRRRTGGYTSKRETSFGVGVCTLRNPLLGPFIFGGPDST